MLATARQRTLQWRFLKGKNVRLNVDPKITKTGSTVRKYLARRNLIEFSAIIYLPVQLITILQKVMDSRKYQIIITTVVVGGNHFMF